MQYYWAVLIICCHKSFISAMGKIVATCTLTRLSVLVPCSSQTSARSAVCANAEMIF